MQDVSPERLAEAVRTVAGGETLLGSRSRCAYRALRPPAARADAAGRARPAYETGLVEPGAARPA